MAVLPVTNCKPASPRGFVLLHITPFGKEHRFMEQPTTRHVISDRLATLREGRDSRCPDVSDVCPVGLFYWLSRGLCFGEAS